jgi:hypothetical protein
MCAASLFSSKAHLELEPNVKDEPRPELAPCSAFRFWKEDGASSACFQNVRTSEDWKRGSQLNALNNRRRSLWLREARGNHFIQAAINGEFQLTLRRRPRSEHPSSKPEAATVNRANSETTPLALFECTPDRDLESRGARMHSALRLFSNAASAAHRNLFAERRR